MTDVSKIMAVFNHDTAGVDVVAQWVELSVEIMLTSHIRVPCYSTSAVASADAAQSSRRCSSVWAPLTQVGYLEEVLGSCFQSDPALAIAGIWEGSQQLDLSLSLSHFKWMKTNNNTLKSLNTHTHTEYSFSWRRGFILTDFPREISFLEGTDF